MTADVAGTPFTGTFGGNGSGQLDTTPSPRALGATTLDVNVAGGNFTVGGPDERSPRPAPS